MKATVVIPTYRRAPRLRALLECLTHQRGDHLRKVVVCDDGSGDETGAVARTYEEHLPLDYAWQEDRGFRAGQARNMGIERAEGDVVIFVDDDVLLRPDFVSHHVEAHAATDAPRSVAIGYRHRTDAFEGRVPSDADVLGAERDDRLVELEGPITEHPTPWVYVYSCNFSVTLGGPELRFDGGFSGWGMEDTELGYRLFHAGYRLLEADRARVLHVEDPAPRDPFRCEQRELPPSYDTYVRNAVYFMDKHPDDEVLREWVRGDLRWYVLDEHGRWVKNGYANDVDYVIEKCREQLRTARPDEPPIRESA
ncbi:MAG TPA: glycosyltransferase [Sandaracinaceae bacterium LLY-WYZ-13_1]|nr:glycosyltransferase [Sandaracinaceae bacterium LLY-WYZ-13_1]